MTDFQVTLREHLEKLLIEQDRRVSLRFDAMDRALILHQANITDRMKELNELHRRMIENEGKFAVVKDVDNLATRITILETRYLTWGTVLLGVVVLLNFAFRFWS